MREIVHPKIVAKSRLRFGVPLKACIILISALGLFALYGCEQQRPKKGETTYNISIAQLEKDYGRLVTVANMPTPDQNGTGDRLGLFRDESGTIWGIPLTRDGNGNVLGCVPASLREVPVSDTLPENTAEIVGASNEPNGWRGGTGNLELLLRDRQGGLIWHSVKEVEAKLDPVCWSQSSPVQPLNYYRLVIVGAGK